MPNPYISQDQPIILIGAYWVDDARGIEYQVQDAKEPLYGFRDTVFRSVARGQRLVHGMLDLNFRYKNYLPTILSYLNEDGLQKSDDETDTAYFRRLNMVARNNELRDLAVDPQNISDEDYISLLEKPHQEFDIAGFTRLSSAVQDSLWGKQSDRAAITGRAAIQSTITAWPSLDEVPQGIDLTLVYLDTDPTDPSAELDNSVVRKLLGVYFISEGQVMRNEVPGGGEALIERYQFIARTIE